MGIASGSTHPTMALDDIGSLGGSAMPGHRIFTTSFASVYPLYVHKAPHKRRTGKEGRLSTATPIEEEPIARDG